MTRAPRAIFVTGPPGAGKSTCIERVAAGCGLVVDGVISSEIRVNGKRGGFQMQLIGQEKTGLLASPDVESQYRFGTLRPSDGLPRLGVTHDFLLQVVCPHLASLPGQVDVVVVDEIGSMQATCVEFRQVIEGVIGSGTPLLASISLADDPWIAALRDMSAIPVLGLSRFNRDLITEMLTKYIPTWTGS